MVLMARPVMRYFFASVMRDGGARGWMSARPFRS